MNRTITLDAFPLGQVYKLGRVGLDIVHSMTHAMDFSFLTSLFSGTDLASTTFAGGVGLFVLGTIMRFCYWAFERFTIRWSMTAQFDEGDPACEWLVNYLTEENVWKWSREFLVSAKSSQPRWGIKMRSSIESAEYVPNYDKRHSFRWKGYWIDIQRTEIPYDSTKLGTLKPGTARSCLLLTMYTLDIEVLSNLVEEARLKYIEGRRPHVIIHSLDFGSTWCVGKRRDRRPLESIILPEGFLNTLVNDVKDFLQSENWYIRAGIPYRRGYLLFGPQGTGKTSTIYALAGELGLEIYTISLSSGLDDNTLQRAISSLPKHSIFLLEDIDCAFPSREEAEKEERKMRHGVYSPGAQAYTHKPLVKVTMSGLLNILDGVGSESGKLFFATTNYVDRLDPALLRPGRIDYRAEYKFATKLQAIALFKRFYPRRDSIAADGSASTHLSYLPNYAEKQWDGTLPYSTSKEELDRLSVEFALYLPDNELTTAELQGYLLLHKKDPREAVKNVAKWAESERTEKERTKEVEAARKAKLAEEDKENDVLPASPRRAAEAHGPSLPIGRRRKDTQNKRDPWGFVVKSQPGSASAHDDDDDD